jgi:hypothetical protein
MDVRKMVWEDVNWMQLTHDAGSYEHGNETSASIKDGEFVD